MKTNSPKTNRRVWLGAATGFALILLTASPQTALAQQWTTNGNDISNANTGNVGVGTTSTPAYKLDVLSNSNIIARFGSTAAAHNQLLINAPAGYNSNLTLQNGGVPKWYLGNRADNNRFSFIESTGTIEVFSILQNGNVGIGTTTPVKPLHVLATNYATGIGVGKNDNLNLLLFGYDTTNNVGAIGSYAGGYGSTLTLNRDGGSVGIGTATPGSGYKLDVAGNINATGVNISGSPIASSVFGRTGAVVAATNDYTWAQIDKTTSSLANLTTRSAGDLSSGTLPDARFPATLPAVSGANLTSLNASSLASGTVAAARLGSGTADATTFLRGDNTWAVPSGATQWTTSGSNINYATSGGNVGVGQANPAYKLDVNGTAHVSGNMTVDGNLAAKYQDMAEWVPSSEQLPTGTVVVLDSTKSNQVTASSQAYDTRVAGVVSEQPGIALGERGADKVLVATTGRVRVKVDASRGPIQVGDLLVTSDTPGMAMKSEPIKVGGRLMHMPGTLIGKALEPLEKGSGKILVLLSLQ